MSYFDSLHTSDSECIMKEEVQVSYSDDGMKLVLVVVAPAPPDRRYRQFSAIASRAER